MSEWEILEDAPPETWAEWEPELRRLLWRSRDDLRGAQLVSALKAIADLVEAERRANEAQQTEHREPLLDRLDALPPDTVNELLDAEIKRIDGYRKRLLAARKRMAA